MKFKGGYNVQLVGERAKKITRLSVPETLQVPLSSLHCSFSTMQVKNGEVVSAGQVLAVDPQVYELPLLAPASGTVKVDSDTNVITISHAVEIPTAQVSESGLSNKRQMATGEAGAKRHALFSHGAWQVIGDVFSDTIADPYGTPEALIVAADHTEPFLSQAEYLLADQSDIFEKGLYELHVLSGVKTVYLVVHCKSGALQKMRAVAQKNSWISLIETPSKYPYDKPKLIAQQMKFSSKNTVWSCDVEGVLAVGQVLTEKKPYLFRTIAISGPGAAKAAYCTVPVGYPLQQLIAEYAASGEVRAVNGGVLSGVTIPEGQQGVDLECSAITLVPEQVTREFLAFADPGFTKHSFSRTFFGALRPLFPEKYTTGIRGERRPCLSCGFCEGVCPAGLMPHLMYKYVKKKRFDEARQFNLMDCVQCGLCSHVCTSKIELKQGFLEAQQIIRQEIQAEKEHV